MMDLGVMAWTGLLSQYGGALRITRPEAYDLLRVPKGKGLSQPRRTSPVDREFGMGFDLTNSSFAEYADLNAALASPYSERRWYAIYTLPQNEKSVLRRLELKGIETFLPTFETLRGWKNRQSVRIELPLFPTYLFARVKRSERVKILECPGVLRIVGYGRESIALSDEEVAFLRSGFCGRKPEPFRDLLVGQRVRIKHGTMQGVEGVLIRRNHNLRFVLTIKLINQHAAVEVSAESLERVSD